MCLLDSIFAVNFTGFENIGQGHGMQIYFGYCVLLFT